MRRAASTVISLVVVAPLVLVALASRDPARTIPRTPRRAGVATDLAGSEQEQRVRGGRNTRARSAQGSPRIPRKAPREQAPMEPDEATVMAPPLGQHHHEPLHVSITTLHRQATERGLQIRHVGLRLHSPLPTIESEPHVPRSRVPFGRERTSNARPTVSGSSARNLPISRAWPSSRIGSPPGKVAARRSRPTAPRISATTWNAMPSALARSKCPTQDDVRPRSSPR
jgi:hypothetical protein